ncbi:MAG: nucleotidyltransferase domain-containing protein [Chloroflexota bacterium]|nr:nucleotidyltransferase domain-containing protein [Chloroflexota bacterium]
MRVPTRPQSYFRCPLNRILASEGAVRVLRELALRGGELSIPPLALATKLNKQTVRDTLLGDLAATGVIEPVGQGRSVSYRLRTAHPLHGAITHLFEAEEAHAQRVFQALEEAAQAIAPVLAIWIYGSVARGEDTPGSDFDVALVLPETNTEPAVAVYRERLRPVLDREQVYASVVGLSPADILRLLEEDAPWWRNVVAEAHPVQGLPPARLADHLRRTQGGKRVA